MKSFTFAILAVIGISYIASVVLENYQATADQANTTSGARPDPEPKLLGLPPKKS